MTIRACPQPCIGSSGAGAGRCSCPCTPCIGSSGLAHVSLFYVTNIPAPARHGCIMGTGTKKKRGKITAARMDEYGGMNTVARAFSNNAEEFVQPLAGSRRPVFQNFCTWRSCPFPSSFFRSPFVFLRQRELGESILFCGDRLTLNHTGTTQRSLKP